VTGPPTLLDVPVVAPMPDAAFENAGGLVEAMMTDSDALVYFVLNIGDGDAQVLLLPAAADGTRRLVIVDIGVSDKVPDLLDELHAVAAIEAPGSPGQVRLLVATHPHNDHIGGMADFVARYPQAGFIDQFWEPGYFHPTPTFLSLVDAMAARDGLRWLQPTSGTSLYLGNVRLTVVGPGVGLRTRFDTYGVNPNDASITLMVDYPAARVSVRLDPAGAGAADDRVVRVVDPAAVRLLLGADAQFTSWAQATIDFPDLEQENNQVLMRELRLAQGPDYLKANLMKLSHHGSKDGVNYELMMRVDPDYTLVSSQVGGGKYMFPHLIAMEAVRESRQPSTTSRIARKADAELGIHVTGNLSDAGAAVGSIAAVVRPAARDKVALYRLFDRPDDAVDLAKARRAR
jgi:Metallo-beta-lactamase superfamily